MGNVLSVVHIRAASLTLTLAKEAPYNLYITIYRYKCSTDKDRMI